MLRLYRLIFYAHKDLCGTGTPACARMESEGCRHRQECLCHIILASARDFSPLPYKASLLDHPITKNTDLWGWASEHQLLASHYPDGRSLSPCGILRPFFYLRS